MSWCVLYRGPLSSCNYACSYCPFAKTQNTREELEHDRACLARFVDWVAQQSEQISILFTPWGEALHHRAYQEAMTRLSHLPHVKRVAIQTNLAARLDWVAEADLETIAFWVTYHPDQVSREKFLASTHRLAQMGARFSVGVVGLKQHFSEIHALRQLLPPATYMWVNAYKRQRDYYDEDQVSWLQKIDPLFNWNRQSHASLGSECAAGETSFTVDGEGHMRRCYFAGGIIGNIYKAGFEQALKPRNCTIGSCGCHIGYVHLKKLKLSEVYGDSILERIPKVPQV